MDEPLVTTEWDPKASAAVASTNPGMLVSEWVVGMLAMVEGSNYACAYPFIDMSARQLDVSLTRFARGCKAVAVFI